MAAQSTPASQVVSETAKAEGGPDKGSTSAQMQSWVGKTETYEQAAEEVGSKLQNAPENVTSEVTRSTCLAVEGTMLILLAAGCRVHEVSRSSRTDHSLTPSAQRLNTLLPPMRAPLKAVLSESVRKSTI